MKRPALRGIALIFALTLAAAPLGAQTATLVKDINPSEDATGQGSHSSPWWLHAMGDKVFFTAEEASSGREMWVTDGTGPGTELLADACPGECSSQPLPLGHAGGILFWTTDSFTHDAQLWRSDGTRAGTFLLTPKESGIRLGLDLFLDRALFEISGRLLFFVGCTAEAGCELWVSDGTRAGTRLVKDFTPGGSSSSLGLQAAGGKVFVVRNDYSTSPQTLWTTDGTAAGTVLVKDFGAGKLDNMVTAGGRLFFTFGSDLWTSDGTSAGTRQLTRFSTPQPFVKPQDGPALKASGRRVYFVADDSVHGQELWRSDGTAAGTERLTDFASAAPFDIRFLITFVEEVGDRAVFIATDGVSVPKLWTSRGSPDSVTALPVPCGGACEFLPQGAALLRAGDRVFFIAGDGVHGKELWTTDGTAAGTRMLRDACPGTCDGVTDFSGSSAVAGKLLFEAWSQAGNRELWSSDGTPAGTRRFPSPPSGSLFVGQGGAVMSGGKVYLSGGGSHGEELWVVEEGQARLVADIAREGWDSSPASLVPYQGGLAFTAVDGSTFRTEVWRSDASSAGTFPLTSSPAGFAFSPSGLTVAGTSLFFFADSRLSSGQDLWRSDGTAAGTVSLVTGRSLTQPAALASSLYFFSAALETSDPELWQSDGTAAGTHLVFAFSFQGVASEMKALDGRLYFVIFPFSQPRPQLWRSDGTAAGTFKLADYTGAEELRLFRLGARVFFLDDGSLWSTDGTPAGTRSVKSFENASATDLVMLDGVLYLIVRDSAGQALWRSDGSAAGTVSLGRLSAAGSLYFDHIRLTAAAGRLFFVLDDGVHGGELWSNDGTAGGTRLVRDIFPGSGSSVPSSLTAAGGRLFFTAVDGTHGFELWQSDGTEAGTRLVQDIAPEAASSTPDQLTLAGDRLFFTADDGIAGRELWSLPLAAPGCHPSPSELCLGGRYRVEAVWRDFQGRSGRGTGIALTADTGYFWFFDPSNVEVVVKTLDGQGLNGHGWVFYGALSNVQYDLTVTDTQTGLTRRYSNIEGRFASVGDTHAFGPLGAYGTERPQVAPPSPPPLIEERLGRVSAAPCQPSARRLCLNNNRFAVEVAWKDFQNRTGKGTAVPLTGDTGTFWFFDAANVELVVKALDGRAFNGKYWLFYGALSNVEYTLTVTDTQTGTIRTYRNPSGRFASVGDTDAF